MKEINELPNNIVLPDYEHCILNTMSSILNYYNVETDYKSLERLDKILKEKHYRNIIFIVLDGLGEHILNDVSPNGFLNSNKIDCVTSVYPSTTSAALTSYYSGKSPYETGWIGWSQYFKEYGRALDIFSHKESYMGEMLKNPRIDVFKEEMKYEPICEKIEKASPNIKAYDVEPKYSERRALRTCVADNIDEIIVDIKDLCTIPGEKFIFAYSDNPDATLHKFGTDSEEVKNNIIDIENKIHKMVDELDEDTILIISADHGHKNIDKVYSTIELPEIQECLIMPPTLESRFLSFFVKEEMKKEFVERFNERFKNEFLLLSKEKFLNKYHFLGYGKKHPKVDDFIGNYVALSSAGSMIRLETFLAEGKPVKKSTHCGVTKEEMEVPVIVCKK